MCLVPLEANVLEERMYLFHNQCWIQDFPEGRQSQSRALTYYYRPQRSCGKVMFLHLSVILSMGGGCLPQCMLGYTPPANPSWADTPQADNTHTPPGRHPPGQTPPRQTPSRIDTPPADTPRPSLQRTVRILLEYILVWHNICRKLHENEKMD